MLEEAAGQAVIEGELLSEHTSFHIGGPARLFLSATSPGALAGILKAARGLGIDTLVMGGGTNLLVGDDGFDGLAVRLSLDDLEMDPDRNRAVVQAGFATADLVERTVAAGLGGLAFAAGLPGTVGGGLAGNAGCFGQTLAGALVRATVVSPAGEIISVSDLEWFQFRYRHSRLLTSGHVIAEAELRFETADREALEEETRKHIQLRREKHPAPGSRTAGSYFKNLPPAKCGDRRQAAGWFLDQVGAKELRVGDAAVFEKHANIIVNRGRATARDVLTLAEEMRRRVRERFDIDLQPEVRFVGRRPSIGHF